jgi:hypothetical protein
MLIELFNILLLIVLGTLAPKLKKVKYYCKLEQKIQTLMQMDGFITTVLKKQIYTSK